MEAVMKIALLTNYPWVDLVDWKKQLVLQLQKDGHTVEVHYGKAGAFSHLNTYLKLRRHRQPEQQPTRSKRRRSNLIEFLSSGLRVRVHRDLNSPRTIEKIAERNYDYHITALDQILSKKFLHTLPKVLNVHYGKLPEIKGIDSIEWTLLETQSLAFSLHYVAEKVDTGDIIHIETVPFEPSMSLRECRESIQTRIPNIYSRFFQGEFNTPIQNDGGKLYSHMHPDLYSLLHSA
jgi:folate-dependent phosphoribosylglycinamide formyltransferase PurN